MVLFCTRRVENVQDAHLVVDCHLLAVAVINFNGGVILFYESVLGQLDCQCRLSGQWSVEEENNFTVLDVPNIASTHDHDSEGRHSC